MSPPLQYIGTHDSEVMYFGCFCFRGELGFLYCDYICMCVVIKQFELLKSIEISLTFTAGSVGRSMRRD